MAKELKKGNKSVSAKASVTEKELAEKLATPAPAKKDLKKGNRNATASAEVPVTPAKPLTKKNEKPVVAEPQKSAKVASLADKKKEKDAKAEKPKVAPVVEDVDDEDGDMEWEEMFEEVIQTPKFTYTRTEDLTLEDFKAHLPKFDIMMLAGEQRKDGNFARYILCYVSNETITLINQTGTRSGNLDEHEDYDELIQRPHEHFIGKRALVIKHKGKPAEIPIAFYIKKAKRGASKGE